MGVFGSLLKHTALHLLQLLIHISRHVEQPLASTAKLLYLAVDNLVKKQSDLTVNLAAFFKDIICSVAADIEQQTKQQTKQQEASVDFAVRSLQLTSTAWQANSNPAI